MRHGDRVHLNDLPDDIAACQQAAVESPQRLRRARLRFLAATNGRAVVRPHRFQLAPRLVWGAISLAVALTGAVLVVRTLRASPLTFEVGSTSTSLAGRVGAPLQAPAAAPMAVRFSDGTALSATPGSTLRIAEVGPHGAGVVLEDGALGATVIHRPRSRWQVFAGPYRVLVTGTRFDVRWSAARRSFALDLQEGAVTVFGPALGSEGKRILPHQKVRLVAALEGLAPSPSPSPSTSGEPRPSRASNTHVSPADPADRPATSPPALPRTSGPRSSWRSLALSGRYDDAWQAAVAEGFDTLRQRASLGDLLLLGNTARFAKHTNEAELVFQAARTRPGAADKHAFAAFQLGRLASDARGDHVQGASWFEAYLSETPDGPLAPDAAGRAVDAHRLAGNDAAAKEAARRYLRRYAGGPYESLARRVLIR